MADATVINIGEGLIIPAQVCYPDGSTCLLVAGEPAPDCVLGGPHTYTTLPNDICTVAYIALAKFDIILDSLWNNMTAARLNVTDAYSVIATGDSIKLPQCSPSQCIVQPYEFTYGTYEDLAAKLGATPGQIFAFNPEYYHSEALTGSGPVITIPMNCVALSSNVSVTS